jgi:hypothetical protein
MSTKKRMTQIADVHVDLDKLVAVLKGDWDDDAQDWYAILLMEGDTRVSLTRFSPHALLRNVLVQIHRNERPTE